MGESLLSARLTAEETLASLRWEANTVVTNPMGDKVWLKSCFLEGKRIGITDCCFVDDPCSRHQEKQREHE